MVMLTELKRIGQGREAEVFAWGDDAVLKLYFSQEKAGSRATEMAAMNAARSAGAPAPGALESVEIEGRPGFVMERCDGIDMLTQFGRKPWTVFSAGYAMGVAHAQLHAVAAPLELRSAKAGARARLEGSDLVPPDLRGVALAALDRLPDGDRLCHGDYHPANVILTAAGPRVIDWPGAYSGDPDADVARTLLTLQIGEPPEGTAALVRVLAVMGRKIMIFFYKRGYRSVRKFDDAAIESWMLPVAIHRLGDGIPEERQKLLALIERLRAAAS